MNRGFIMFEYDISIIVPVYNASEFIEATIESIIKNMNNASDLKVEVLFIDDGSEDNSAEICNQYVNVYDNFSYIYQSNQGVSAARNHGLRIAQGKYILFLDSDDLLGEHTLKNVFKTFEMYQDQADILGYPLYNIKGKKVTPHARNTNYKVQGVYDIEIHPFINQSTMNVVVKNVKDKVFFEEDLSYGEDSFFNTQMIMRKNKIIICNKGKYIYRVGNVSAVYKHRNPATNYLKTLNYFEKLIGQFSQNNKIPKYVQGIILYEINWRFKSNSLFPYHLDEIKMQEWNQRFEKILNLIDIDTIKEHPMMDYFHKFYFIEKKAKDEISIYNDSKIILIKANKEILKKLTLFQLVFNKIKCKDNRLIVNGIIKEPLLEKFDGLKLVVLDKKNDQYIECDLKESNHSYYKVKFKSNHFVNFEINLPIESNKYEFKVYYGGFYYNTLHYFMPDVVFNNSNKILYNKFIINYKSKPFTIQIKPTTSIIEKFKLLRTDFKVLKAKKYWFFKYFSKYIPINNVWIYNDRINVFDNAYIQFKHDFCKKDGIKRYYVTYKDEDINGYFTEEEKKYLVQYASLKHRILLMKTSMILTSFQAFKEYMPFHPKVFSFLFEKFKYQIIYLQHGILHAHTPWIYGKEKSRVDKIVISSDFEKNNLINNYNYSENDLIPVTMPRLVSFDKNIENNTRRILFAPTWRASLTEGMNGLKWNVELNRFIESTYYKKINELLNFQKLIDYLEENNIYLDFNLHPIFKEFNEVFSSKSDNIKIVSGNVDINNYSAFITDFSSYVFDFVMMRIPIFYFVPDYDEFLCGNHTYNKLDMPIENGFGPFVQEVEDIILEIKKCVENDFLIQDNYINKYKEFFYDVENNKERLYKYLIDLDQSK